MHCTLCVCNKEELLKCELCEIRSAFFYMLDNYLTIKEQSTKCCVQWNWESAAEISANTSSHALQQIIKDIFAMLNIIHIHTSKHGEFAFTGTQLHLRIQGFSLEYSELFRLVSRRFDILLLNLNILKIKDVQSLKKQYERTIKAQKELQTLLSQQDAVLQDSEEYTKMVMEYNELIIRNKMLKLKEEEIQKKLCKLMFDLEKMGGKMDALCANQQAAVLLNENIAALEESIALVEDLMVSLTKSRVEDETVQQMEIIRFQKNALKCQLKELPFQLEKLNNVLHGKETALGNHRKTTAAVIKTERERVQELDLAQLKIRSQNLTEVFQEFVYQRKKEVSQLYKDFMLAMSEDERRIIRENLNRVVNTINEAKISLKKASLNYKSYMEAIRNGAMLYIMPEINDPFLPSRPKLLKPNHVF